MEKGGLEWIRCHVCWIKLYIQSLKSPNDTLNVCSQTQKKKSKETWWFFDTFFFKVNLISSQKIFTGFFLLHAGHLAGFPLHLGLLEDIADPGSSHPNEELNELRSRGLDEGNASFTSTIGLGCEWIWKTQETNDNMIKLGTNCPWNTF